MCADFEVHVNGKSITEAYPLPCLETFFVRNSGANCYAKFDLSNAYCQIGLDEGAQAICTINTTRGLFRVTRPQQGLQSAAAIFATGNGVNFEATLWCCGISRRHPFAWFH